MFSEEAYFASLFPDFPSSASSASTTAAESVAVETSAPSVSAISQDVLDDLFAQLQDLSAPKEPPTKTRKLDKG